MIGGGPSRCSIGLWKFGGCPGPTVRGEVRSNNRSYYLRRSRTSSVITRPPHLSIQEIKKQQEVTVIAALY